MELSKLPPSKRLDSVLKLINEVPDPFFINGHALNTKLREAGFEFTDKDLWSLVNKLKKDGFVDEHTTRDGVLCYFTTFDGQSLLELEKGYTGRLKSKGYSIFKEVVLVLSSGIIGALAGGILTVSQEWFRPPNQPIKIDSLTIRAFHEVLRQESQKISADTSLVKIVKDKPIQKGNKKNTKRR